MVGGIFRYWCSLDAEEPATKRSDVELSVRAVETKRCFDNGGQSLCLPLKKEYELMITAGGIFRYWCSLDAEEEPTSKRSDWTR